MNKSTYLNYNRNKKSEYLAYSLLTFISPLIGIVLICSYYLNNMNRRNYIINDKYMTIPLALIFATFGYCMTFRYGYENDLTRYFEQLQDFRSQDSLYQILKNDQTMLYVRDILFYFVSKSNDFHILSYIVGFGIYAIVLYISYVILLKTTIKLSYKDIIKILIITTCFTSPFSVIGNTRCVFAFVLMSFAIYRETVQNKRNITTVLLYILPLGLHIAAFSILFARVFQYMSKHVGIHSFIFLAIFFPFVVDFIYELHLDGILGAFIDKAYYYLHWTEGGFADDVDVSIWYKIERTSCIIMLSLFVLFLLILNKKQKNQIMKYSMTRFLVCIASFAVASLFIKTGSLWRYVALFVFFCPYIIVRLFELEFTKTRYFLNVVFLLSIVYIILNAIKMYMALDPLESFINYCSFCGLNILF